MSVQEALTAAGAGRIALLLAPDLTSAELAAQLGPGARVLTPDDLVLGGPDTPGALVVISLAEGLVGLIDGCWAGPWALRAWHTRARPEATLLHARCAHPAVVARMREVLAVTTFGEVAEIGADVEPTDAVDPSRVTAALTRAGEGAVVVSQEEGELLRDAAYAGQLPAVWRVPFLLRVANDRRFKSPFVDRDPELAEFHATYRDHVGGLGMLESAEYKLHGRHDKDLRRFSHALDIPVLDLVRIFRKLDRAGLVISVGVEEGSGDRPNLVIEGADPQPDPARVVAGIQELRDLRTALGLVADADRTSPPATVEEISPIDSLFSSLESLEPASAMQDSPPEPGPDAGLDSEPEGIPEDEIELPTHLPGLVALVAGDLASARAELGAVEGELAAEALLLGGFCYEVLAEDGEATRFYAIPAPVVEMASRALELERVPAERIRTSLDRDFPEAFVELPRPGLVEIFFDGGELAGTHRLRELAGRRDFEGGKLKGARAVQRELAAGRTSDDDPRDEGWATLAEVLALRDAGEGLTAWETLERVDVDLDLSVLRSELIELLPAEHEERAALEQRRAEERAERELRQIRNGLGLALRTRGQEDDAGHGALEAAEAAGRLDEISSFLERMAERNPRDPGPHLWLARLRLRQADLREAEAAYFDAAYTVMGRSAGVEWWFELVDRALRDEKLVWMWGAFKRFLKEDPDSPAFDRLVAARLDEGTYGDDIRPDLRKILDRFGGPHRFPNAWRHLQKDDDVDDWRSALMKFKPSD